jgi:hypothetical protein
LWRPSEQRVGNDAPFRDVDLRGEAADLLSVSRPDERKTLAHLAVEHAGADRHLDLEEDRLIRSLDEPGADGVIAICSIGPSICWEATASS